MDNSKIIALHKEQVRAVRAIYEEETNKNQPVHTFKTLDEDVKVGDLVIDQSNFALHKEQEAKAISVVQQAQLRRKKAELREAMFKDHEDKIATLALATPTPPAE